MPELFAILTFVVTYKDQQKERIMTAKLLLLNRVTYLYKGVGKGSFGMIYSKRFFNNNDDVGLKI